MKKTSPEKNADIIASSQHNKITSLPLSELKKYPPPDNRQPAWHCPEKTLFKRAKYI